MARLSRLPLLTEDNPTLGGSPATAETSDEDVDDAGAAAAAAADDSAAETRAAAIRRVWQREYASILSALAFIASAGVPLGLLIADYRPPGGPRVDLGYTTYVGTALDSGINVFLGMRYATPPTGNLRWRAPVEPERFPGSVTRAKAFGPICLATGAGYPNNGQDEDCLYVNVWAPANTTTASKLPVWLFIQGGGYTANSNANWNGEAVIKRSGNQIIFVNFNYRVGSWGFLTGDKVRKDGHLNVGMLDQRFVLQWIQKHISKFGGDPNHVVIYGVSAGAGSVALHLTAYGGRDDKLFVGGIIGSVFFPAQPFVSDLEWQFERYARDAGCGSDTAPNQMACLRNRDTMTLQRANSASPYPGRFEWPLFYWTPCVDGDLIRDLPYNLFEQGRFIDVPLIVGTDTDEGSYFSANAATQDEIGTFFLNNFPGLGEGDVSRILDRYPQMEALPNHNAWFPSASLAYGESVFVCPTVSILDGYAEKKNRGSSSSSSGSPLRAWSYRYNVQDDENAAQGLGVPHTFDTAAVFGPESIGGARASYWTYNAPIVPVVMDYWLSFVRLLDPNAAKNEGAPDWAGWTSSLPGGGSGSGGVVGSAAGNNGRSRLVIETGNTRMEQTPSDQVSRCQFWKSLKDATQQKL